MEIIYEKAVIFRGAISAPEGLVDFSKENPWKVNRLQHHGDGKFYRSESNVYLTDETDYGKKFFGELIECLVKYHEEFKHTGDISPIQGIREHPFEISRYAPGGFITSHVDEEMTEDTGLRTIIIYLNGEFEGGELNFDEPEIKVSIGAGDVLIFPCHYPHSADVVTSGEKFMTIFRIPFE